MKKTFILIVAVVMFAACGGDGVKVSGPIDVAPFYNVGDATFNMASTEGGFFTKGLLRNSRKIKGAESYGAKIVDGFAIMEEPVSQALWQAVMGGNPSSLKSAELPVDKVSLKDCEKFAKELSKKVGIPFVVPTETMYEFAVYSGIVKPLKGFQEWVSDKFTEKGSQQTVRTPEERRGVPEGTLGAGLGVRLAVVTGRTAPQRFVDAFEGNLGRDSVCNDETIKVGGQTIVMKAVKGGEFQMGDRKDVGSQNEKPVHVVNVADFEIAQTEVTAGLWQEVMGYLPLGNYPNLPELPVVNVSWYSAQEFIMKLNELTGRKFRLPMEAEWEYAARGGVKDRDVLFSGSDVPNVVCVDNTVSKKGDIRPVKSMQPNEIGIYDMSGNVWEWVNDSYSVFGDKVQNPAVKVIRGGSAASPSKACTVSNRTPVPGANIKSTIGFRLAL